MLCITDFCDDLLINILKKLLCNRTSCMFVETCKDFRRIGNKYGWIRSVKLDKNSYIKDFIEFYTRKNIILEKLTLEGLHYASWLKTIQLPKEIKFNRCGVGNNLLNITQIQQTEKLVIRDIQRNSLRTCVHINWKMLPKLKVLDIYAPDLDFNELDLCKDLEIIRIDLDKVRELPKFFESLPNLQIIATTCITFHEFHFVSKSLKCCVVPKKCNFTSNSTLVPTSHLDIAFKMNIQCIEI